MGVGGWWWEVGGRRLVVGGWLWEVGGGLGFKLILIIFGSL